MYDFSMWVFACGTFAGTIVLVVGTIVLVALALKAQKK
jgi:hypothetical protein